MYYKPLGNTGKQVSAVSFGGMRFKAEEYKKLFATFLDSVNVFDDEVALILIFYP